MDARKWCTKWRNWNISYKFFSLSWIEERNQRKLPEKFAPCTGNNAIRESTARKWFSHFKKDRFDISDTPRSGRPSGFDEDCSNTLIHNYSDQCTQKLANVMNCDHSTIERHLHSTGKVKKSGVWVPHALSQNNRNQRVAICASLLAHHRLAHEHRPFLSCIFNGDEKWCLYANIRKRKEWLSPNKRRICRKYSNFSTWQSMFLYPRLHSSLNDKFSICKLKHNNWTSNKKWQSINKSIATGIPTCETKLLRNYIPT